MCIAAGPPKPITMCHATFAVIDNERNMPTVPGRKNSDSTLYNFPTHGKFYTCFPPSHVGSILQVDRDVHSNEHCVACRHLFLLALAHILHKRINGFGAPSGGPQRPNDLSNYASSQAPIIIPSSIYNRANRSRAPRT